MTVIRRFIYLGFASLTCGVISLSGPAQPEVSDGLLEPSREGVNEVFERIRSGFEAGNINYFANILAAQVQLNLRGAESGSFSSHQTYYLLENYFRDRRLAGLSFTTIAASGQMPYATGGASLAYKGARDRVQVYVSLTLIGDRWVLSRLSIY